MSNPRTNDQSDPVLTLEQLSDIHAIERLKYRYLRLLDTKQWEGFAECFAPEATADYNGLAFDDPTSLVAYMRENMHAGVITMHQAHNPEIDLDPNDPDRASATWYLHDRVIVDAFRFELEGAAIYTDRYRRTEAGWRIVHVGYTRTFELTRHMDDPTKTKIAGPEVKARW